MRLVNKLLKRDRNKQCSLDIHHGHWTYNAHDSCGQDLRCTTPGCGAIDTRTVHAWDNGTHAPTDQSPCRTRFTCTRDHATKMIEIHPYAAGKSVLAVAQEFGVHRTTVTAHLDRHGVSRRPNRHRLTGADIERAAPHYSG